MIVTGTITDKITSRSKTFTLNLTLVLFNSNSVINDQTISWVSEAGSSDKGKKIKVTFTGSGLSTNQGDWTITAKDSSSSSSTWTIDQASSSPTSVSFTIEYNKDTIGKNYTFSVNGIQGAKDVTIPTSTITSIDSSISTNGDLILKFTGDNLSANLDIYIFTFKPIVNIPPVTTFDGAANNSPATPTTTPPTIDEAFKQNINVDWTSKESITLTIQKVRGNGSQDVITKGLYGLWYEVNVITQTEKKQFKFAEYVAPTGVTVDIFDNPLCGDNQSSITTSIESSAFQGDKLSWTLTVENSASKWVQIKFKKADFLSSLVGQKGFGDTDNGNTTLTWALKENVDNNSKFTYIDDEGLKNNEALTTSGITAVMTGTLTDELTGEVKTFDLSLTIKVTDNTPRISSASSDITENGDLTILLTGSNLPQTANEYKFTYSGSKTADAPNPDLTTDTPNVDSNILELDTTHTNTGSSVQFIIKKIKVKPSSNSFNDESPTLPTAQTTGLYGKTFSVTLVDADSNPHSRDEKQQPVEEKPVTFKFADYVAPKSIESSKFFEKVDSLSKKAVSSQQNGGNLSEQLDFFPLTQGDISQQDPSNPLEWTITSPYKSLKYIYLNLPSSDKILDSVKGWKGFSKNLHSDATQDEQPGTYTSVSWQFKGQTNNDFEDLNSSSNVLHNKNELTDNNPISAILTATITDKLTNESVTFDIKIILKLGNLNDPTITKGEVTSSENDTVKVTITGTDLPTDIRQWDIKENTSVFSQQAEGEREGGASNSNPWTIKTSTSSPTTSIEFSAKQNEVAGRKYDFSLVGFSTVKTTVTCPTSNPDSNLNQK